MSIDHRPSYEADGRPGLADVSSNSNHVRPVDANNLNTSDNGPPEFSLLVAGCRGGKTSFLRLLLDTSNISANTSQDQLSSVAKFVQGCSSHTSHIKSTSIVVDADIDGIPRSLALTLVDTPSIDFRDASAADRLLSETLRYIDSRFAEGLDDDWKAHSEERFVHLCIYFLDPDQIVPLSVPSPPAPIISRAHASGFSQSDIEPVILEPPLQTNPLLQRPTLPTEDVEAIRRLSARVNVLPVISRADTLSNDRLSAIKMAVRKDLADAGIGFGIFDVDTAYQQHSIEDLSVPRPSAGYALPPTGSASSRNNSPPASPPAPSLLRLPYSLISPDMYSHSDGVPRIPMSRQNLVLQYSPSYRQPSPPKLIRGKYVRAYRWGALDVLDPSHSDFLTLRSAIFHHMETLQSYTREYLFNKFKMENQLSQRPTSRHSLSSSSHLNQVMVQQVPISQPARPILAIDTSPPSSLSRQVSGPAPMDLAIGNSIRSSSVPNRTMPDSRSSLSNNPLPAKLSAPKPARQRSKKINVACNFCRSRKLKCDGVRPACAQCVKRSNSCDYPFRGKRRNTLRQEDEESESDSIEEQYQEPEREPSVSPGMSQSSTLSRRTAYAYPQIPPLRNSANEGSSSRMRLPGNDTRSSIFMDNELPHIATLALPEPSPNATPVPMSAPSFPLIRPASDQQAAQRKRSATVPGKSTRLPSTAGPKIVACNFCRARKTKCDGGHPACSSCARRSLACNYIHENPTSGGRKAPRRASTSTLKTGTTDSPASTLTSRMPPTPQSYELHPYGLKSESEFDLKRRLSPLDGRPIKKMRMEVPQ